MIAASPIAGDGTPTQAQRFTISKTRAGFGRVRMPPATESAAGVLAPELSPLASPVLPERDRLLPFVIAVSLILHAVVLLPFRGEPVPPAPREIPVDLVQMPPKPVPRPLVATRSKPPISPARAQAQAQTHPAPRLAAKKPPPMSGGSMTDRLKSLLGPMPAFALPGTAEAGTEPVSYSQLVLSKVAKAKKQGRYRGVPGHAGVAFHLGDQGEIVSVALVQPSGDSSLDEEAVAMVKRAAP